MTLQCLTRKDVKYEFEVGMGNQIFQLTGYITEFFLVRKAEFSSVFAQSSFGYQITSCFITQWLRNMRTVLSTCHAMPSLVNALK